MLLIALMLGAVPPFYMIRAQRYASYTNAFATGTKVEKTVTVVASDKVLRVAAAWTQPVTTSTGTSVGSLRDFKLELFNPSGTRVAISDGVNNCAELIDYTVNGKTGEYKIVVTSKGGSAGTIRMGLAWW